LTTEYSDSYRSFEEHCIWLDDTIRDMFENLPSDLNDMPHTDEETAALSYGSAYAEHYSAASRERISHYGPSRAKQRLNIGQRHRSNENGRWW